MFLSLGGKSGGRSAVPEFVGRLLTGTARDLPLLIHGVLKNLAPEPEDLDLGSGDVLDVQCRDGAGTMAKGDGFDTRLCPFTFP